MKIKYLTLIFLLTGCSSKPEISNLHLPWPTPIYKIGKLESLSVDKQARVSLSWEDFNTLSLLQLDTVRYIKDMQAMVCTYQPSDKLCKDTK